ncbi:MAG TPA: MBL fold metallo-hydrolase [Roseiflexaceae bacterium]|nr:MBL fold metallo-hydrolase [Roseiflexaceae bacterium]
MTLCVTSLASGSSGNALLIQADGAALLIDCGLPQRAIERHLAHAGLRPANLTAILLTHEHGDHVLSAGPLARRHGIPVVANAETAAALGPALGGVALLDMAVGDRMALGPFGVRSFGVPHDAAAPVGYTIQVGGWCVGVAIDLGSWDEGVLEGLRAADLVVLESNHDRERLRLAPYDWAVKQRIYSRLGHLDNMDAGALLARLGADGRRRTAWLAHLSERANSPEIATRIVSSVLSVAQVACFDIRALPRRAAVTWESDRHLQQMELFI